MDFFSLSNNILDSDSKPLADRMRPHSFDEFIGQEKILGEGSVLRNLIETDSICSMLLWGPPGSGKTTFAVIISGSTDADFVLLSAVTSTIKDVRAVIEQAKINRKSYNRKTILFIDEIHRFNKAQQDAFLPYVEDGTLVLIGATTENPSFSVIAPLLSRCRVFVLERLNDNELNQILENAIRNEEKGLGKFNLSYEEETLDLIIRLSDGDARRALNLLELAVTSLKAQKSEKMRVTVEVIKAVAQRQQLIYDKNGEEHFNLISAFHKSLRGSDPDAALYWMGRMFVSGEDPLYLARRMIRFASEDVGNADPQALVIATAAKNAFESLGAPEGELALAQVAVYLATAPKSNSTYAAFNKVMEEIQKSGSLPVPFVIRNAPTPLMKNIGYGEGYIYDQDAPDHYAPQEYLPEEIKDSRFYEPGEFGFEREIRKRLEWWEKKKKESDTSNS